MISGDTIIHVLDCDTGSYLSDAVKNIMVLYAGSLHNIDHGIEIAFQNVKIQNGFGWTDLESIQRINLEEEKSPSPWYALQYRDDPVQGILVTGDEPIVCFDPEKYRMGHNGMRKYKYSLLPVQEAYQLPNYEQPIVRSRTLNDTLESPKQFCRCSILHDQHGIYRKDHPCAYKIRTKNGLYTAEYVWCYGEKDSFREYYA